MSLCLCLPHQVKNWSTNSGTPGPQVWWVSSVLVQRFVDRKSCSTRWDIHSRRSCIWASLWNLGRRVSSIVWMLQLILQSDCKCMWVCTFLQQRRKALHVAKHRQEWCREPLSQAVRVFRIHVCIPYRYWKLFCDRIFATSQWPVQVEVLHSTSTVGGVPIH